MANITKFHIEPRADGALYQINKNIRSLITPMQHKICLRIVKAVLVLIHMFGFIYCTSGKCAIYDQLEQFNDGVVKFVNCLSDFLLVSVNIAGITNISRCRVPIELINFANSKQLLLKKSSSLLLVIIFALRYIVLIPIMINIYFLGFLIGWDMYQYYLGRDVWYFLHNMMISIFLLIAKKICECFSGINCHLLKSSNYYTRSNSMSLQIESISVAIAMNRPMKLQDYLKRLKTITQIHNTLCDYLDKINRKYEPILCMMLLCILGNIFYDCSILIEFGFKPKVINGTKTKPFIFTRHFLLLFIAAAQSSLVAYIGERLEEEGQTTTRICYSLLNKQPLFLKSEAEQLIEKQLTFLLEQSKCRKVCLHAGGYFRINWRILGSIASTVATYSVVIIQFLIK